MARHKVEISVVNTADIKVLSSEETEELFKKLKDGDEFARNDLINGNLKLVLSIIQKFNYMKLQNQLENIMCVFPSSITARNREKRCR